VTDPVATAALSLVELSIGQREQRVGVGIRDPLEIATPSEHVISSPAGRARDGRPQRFRDGVGYL
jgi:hypothetical protein